MRLKEVPKLLNENKLDAIILFSQSPTFRYFLKENFESGVMILTKKMNFLFVNELSKPKFEGFKVISYKDFLKEFKEVIKNYKIKTVGFDEMNILLRQYKFITKHFKLKPLSEKIESIREEKTPEEILRIRKACEITDEVFSLMIKNFKDFKSEIEIARFIKIEFTRRDAELAYEPIVASGRNAVTAHQTPKNELNKGFMVLDIGAKYKGYCADMTRTIYIGKPSEKEIAIYNKLLKVEEECIKAAKTGMKAADLHTLAVKLLGSDSKYFIHSIGHGFGVEIHELPRIGPKSKDKLKANTVITVEPGYYNEKTGIGIRIEDDVYLGKNKEILNKSTKRLICLSTHK